MNRPISEEQHLPFHGDALFWSMYQKNKLPLSKLLVSTSEFSISATTSEALCVFIQCCWSHGYKDHRRHCLPLFILGENTEKPQCKVSQKVFIFQEEWILVWRGFMLSSDHHRSFWKTWLFCVFSLILPLCSSDIPLKWVPSFCRCCVQISSCLWLRRKTCLKENKGLWVFIIIIISLKSLLFFYI